MNEETEPKTRFKINWIIVTILILMWLGIIGFYYIKADEITKDPCGVCAKRMNEEVICTIANVGGIRQRVYYPNFSIGHQQEYNKNFNESKHNYSLDNLKDLVG